MLPTALRFFFSTTALLYVSACSGGGETISSAPTSSGLPTVPTKLTISLDGQTVSASFTKDLGSGKTTISGVTTPKQGSANISTVGSDLVGWSANGSNTPVTFNAMTGDTFTAKKGVVLAESADKQSIGIFVDPSAHGYEHQTFGAWMTGLGSSSGKVGAGSFGKKTGAGNMPTGISATYSGATTGVATLADGQTYLTSSKVSVATDFSDMTFTSADTQAVNINTGTIKTAPELDFIGSGSVSDGTFSANVVGSGTSGSISGVFYGPQANEIGGTFHTSGSGGISHTGSFGGKR